MPITTTSEEDYHYFIVSCLYWNTGMKIHELIAKQKRKDRDKKSPYGASTYAVYRVPVSLSESYTITNYHPDVEGTELLFTEEY